MSSTACGSPSLRRELRADLGQSRLQPGAVAREVRPADGFAHHALERIADGVHPDRVGHAPGDVGAGTVVGERVVVLAARQVEQVPRLQPESRARARP